MLAPLLWAMVGVYGRMEKRMEKTRELRPHNPPQWLIINDLKTSHESVPLKSPTSLSTTGGSSTLGAISLTCGPFGVTVKFQTTADANHSSQVQATGIRDRVETAQHHLHELGRDFLLSPALDD